MSLGCGSFLMGLILIPVAWEQVEPQEGSFDFSHPHSRQFSRPRPAGGQQAFWITASTENGAGQLIVQGKPFVVLGWRVGEFIGGDGGAGGFDHPGDGAAAVEHDPDAKVAGIARIEEVKRAGPHWAVTARLNGDQSNQGRQLSMDPSRVRIYRLRLYSAAP